MVETDDEVEEVALLGDATLAKLSATRKTDEPAPVVADKPEVKVQDDKPKEEKTVESEKVESSPRMD